MFERIVLRRSEDGHYPTVGDLAEALLFYRQVHLMLDDSSVSTLAQAIGIEQLLALLSSKKVTAIYCRDSLATQTQQIGALAHHMFVGVELAGGQDKENYTVSDVIERSIRGAGKYSGRAARKLTETFLAKVPVKSLMSKDFFGARAKNLAEAATADVYDTVYLVEAVSRVLQHTPGFVGFSQALALEVQPTHAGFTVFSNLDLGPTNEARARLVQPLEPVTVAHVLNEIFVARSDMLVAAHYGSYYKTSIIGSKLMELKHSELLQRSTINAEQVASFQEVVVNEGRSLKEVLNSGERSFEEFISLLEKATAFKNWTGGIHPDASMVAEYLKETSREGWLGSLPGKTLRFAIGAAIDSTISGASAVYGLADSFLIDKLSKGWRPNHFVEKRLMPFVNS